LLALLDDDASAEPALAPVREYCTRRAARPRRSSAVAVSSRFELARLFDEYALSRPELLAALVERSFRHR